MATLFVDGFDYLATAQLPGIWDSSTNVTISATLGRGGTGAAFFNAALPATLTKALTWFSDVVQGTVTYLGFAIKQTLATDASRLTIAQLVTNHSTFTLKVQTNGSLQVYQNGTLLLTTPTGLFTVNSGAYVEWKIRLGADLDAAIVRVWGAAGAFSTTAAPLSTLAIGEAFASVTIGGGAGETGQWYVDDFYLNDGLQVAPFLSNDVSIGNDSFFGNVKVDALYATGDGEITTIPTSNGWTPSSGSVHYTRINEHPPDDATTYVSALTPGLCDSYRYYTDRLSANLGGPIFGTTIGGIWAPIYSMQWLGRQKVSGLTTAPICRDKSGSLLAGATLSPGNAWAYTPVIFDRDPIRVPSQPFNFSHFANTNSPDRREFGIKLVG